MENSDNTSNEDMVFEKLLARATTPPVPQGAEARVMAAIGKQSKPSNVVHLRPARRTSRWVMGLPLAASLLLGIYLGTRDSIDSYLPDSVVGSAVAGATDQDMPSGLDEIETYADGDVT